MLPLQAKPDSETRRPLRPNWGMLFYKNSTRTRVSFEVGIRELGGNPLILDQSSTQIGRGESIEDTVRVLSRYLDGLIIRTHGHDIIEEFAQHSSIPVVNALTDFLHPCQIYADCLTILEKTGEHSILSRDCGEKIGFFGDTACNMANSWILAGALFGIEVHLAARLTFDLSPKSRNFAKREVCPGLGVIRKIPERHPRGADVIYTDVWVSMGCEEEEQDRLQKWRLIGWIRKFLPWPRKIACSCIVCPPTREKRLPKKFSTRLRPFFSIRRKTVCTCKNPFFAKSRLRPRSLTLVTHENHTCLFGRFGHFRPRPLVRQRTKCGGHHLLRRRWTRGRTRRSRGKSPLHRGHRTPDSRLGG